MPLAIGIGISPVFGPSGDISSADFNLANIVFTSGMAMRDGPAGVFDGAPIIQGMWDGTGVGDHIAASRGDIVGNQTQSFYELCDVYQGSASFWITPEWDGNDGLIHTIYDIGSTVSIVIRKSVGNELEIRIGGQADGVDVSGWTAGTTYYITVRWDVKNTLDGTNYVCISIDDTHNFLISTQPNVPVVAGNLSIGENGASGELVDAIIEGFTFYRRPLFDGVYGKAVHWDETGALDEIALIYNAGAGIDPTRFTGSWDVVFALPTNQDTSEALGDNPGEHAWSHPLSSSVPANSFLDDGGYFGGAYGVAFNASNTLANAGSAAVLDDLPNGANGFTAGIWFRADSLGEASLGTLFNKSTFGTNGWKVFLNSTVSGFDCRLENLTTDSRTAVEWVPDGKWHYLAIVFKHIDQGGDSVPHLSLDGKWPTPSSQTVGNGAYQTDAAIDLKMGDGFTVTKDFDGVLGWSALWSNNTQYVPGTDFIPPRTPPGAGGALVECWDFDEGTGATAAAKVTTPGNDAALTNHTWEAQWDQESTPMEMTSVTCDGTDTVIDCGSGVSIDDLPNGANGFTWDGWVRVDERKFNYIVEKSNLSTTGFTVRINNVGFVDVTFQCATTDGRSVTNNIIVDDGVWHHISVVFEHPSAGGDGIVYISVDGVWATYGTQITAVGAYGSDAAETLEFGYLLGLALDGALGWQRLSDINTRYTVGTNFVPPARNTPPGNDANAQLLLNVDEGAGTLVADSSGNANNGTLTPAAGGWVNTFDMTVDEPGGLLFNQGYNIGSDGVNDGMTQIATGLPAGTDYVLRVPVSPGQSGVAQAAIQIYDETNAAIITTLNGPPMTGQHSGANNSATLIVATARFPQMLVGWELYNITDGSSTTITAVSGDQTTITGVLAGGTDDDWDTNDVFLLRPPNDEPYSKYPWVETFVIDLPTNARGAAADCTSVSWKVLNLAGDGVLNIHQYEVQESLIDNGSLETGAGNPFIADGWTNSGLGVGESVQDAVNQHSGAACIQYVAATSFQYQSVSYGVGSYFCLGSWMRESVDALHMATGGQQLDQTSLTLAIDRNAVGDVWLPYLAVGRQPVGASFNLIDDGSGRWDDVYGFSLDPVTLTVTPASEANSLESGGIRVDGKDLCSMAIPAGFWGPTQGRARFTYRPRHDGPTALDFGNTAPILAWFYNNGTNLIRVDWVAANTVRLRITIAGVTTTINWATAGYFTVDVDHLIEVRYGAVDIRLIVDGVTRATATPGAGIDFGANVPNIIYYGSDNTALQQNDAVFAAP